MTEFMPRSALYMPANNPRALAKAPSLACDAVILDLEDSVAPTEKAAARQAAAAAMADPTMRVRPLILRTNGLESAEFNADIAVARQADAMLVPKISTLSELAACSAALEGCPARLWVMIETPLAVLDIAALARGAAEAAPQLQAFVLGTNDLAKDTGTALVADRWTMVPWLSQVVLAASAFGLSVLDSVSNNFRDLDTFAAECAQGAALGMDGKTLIHPAQIDACNQAFSPSADALAHAQAVVELFARPENADRGAVQLDGVMVERLHLPGAEQTLARARAFGLI